MSVLFFITLYKAAIAFLFSVFLSMISCGFVFYREETIFVKTKPLNKRL